MSIPDIEHFSTYHIEKLSISGIEKLSLSGIDKISLSLGLRLSATTPTKNATFPGIQVLQGLNAVITSEREGGGARRP